ncbi:MAG: prepilin-type N-terminal cleavage/methylation domain-containing protein [Planctomycetes bacterium]|nr:prepilin-type N-terminal cleavage/methylation domain-containing protein [Planctomycetota bacterium]
MSISSHHRGRGPRPAFSLLELLVVTAIIALLIAIVVPALAKARRSARNLTCVSHLRAFGNALTLYKHDANRYPLVDLDGPPRASGLANIGRHTAEWLVKQYLGGFQAMYCPVSLEDDSRADPPVMPFFDQGQQQYIDFWRTGQISYMYLSGVTHTYPDADNKPTFNPDLESPDSPRAERAVLTGDRTTEFGPKGKNIVGSNHGNQGGWFYFIEGDALWWEWDKLTAHPTAPYIWYWPRRQDVPRPTTPDD